MKPNVAKAVIRAIGTLGALLGAYSLVFMAKFLPDFMNEMGRVVVVFYVLSLIIDAWLLWIGYLVWFRFSPLAVRQACGALGFAAFFGLITTVAIYFPIDANNAGWNLLASLGCFVFVLVAYRVLSRYLNRVIFPLSRAPLPFMPPLPKW